MAENAVKNEICDCKFAIGERIRYEGSTDPSEIIDIVTEDLAVRFADGSWEYILTVNNSYVLADGDCDDSKSTS